MDNYTAATNPTKKNIMKTTNIIETLNTLISGNCQKIDMEARYDDMLDECYSLEKVGGPFAHMSASSVLKNCDPVAYRCGKNDWLDSEEVCEIDGDYYEESEAEQQKEQLKTDLESEIEDLETNISTDEENGGQEREMVKIWNEELIFAKSQLNTLQLHEFSK